MSKKKKTEEMLDDIATNDSVKELQNYLSELDKRILEPSVRVKALADSGNAFEVDQNIPPQKYYRSGLEMVRMADVYLNEGNMENAYILYMKFMTLFLEKIRKHPNFKSVPVVDRAQNDAKLKEVLPKAEKLKMMLLDLYEQEHRIFLQNQSKLKLEMLEKRKHQEEQAKESLEDLKKPPVDDTCNSPKENFPSRPQFLRPLSQLSCILREIVLPSKLTSKFLNLAVRNTEQNKETLGILAGVLRRDQMIISHLLIPKQVGSSDFCSSESEEEIFAFQDEHNLITLGWIHTHPSQAAFLSSIDLHTHCAYQQMLPEALAIVCSVKNHDNSYFTLTSDHGLDFIGSCRETGFHPHPMDPPLYKKADHVKLEDLPVEVVDLRRS